MLFVQTPNDFDHTAGCYVTDYVLSAALLVIAAAALLKMLTQKHVQKIPENERLFDILTAFGCCLAFVYSLTGGIVHQEYNDPHDETKYTVIWTIGTTFGFIGFSLCGYAGYCISLPVNAWSWGIFTLLEIAFVCLSWTYKNSLNVLTSVTFLSLIFIIIGCYVLFRSQRSEPELRRHNSRALIVLGVGLVIIFVGAICELCKASMDPAFNYNAIYHVCTTVGLGVAYFALFFMFDFKQPRREVVSGPDV